MVPQIQRGYATGIANDGHGGPGGFNVSWAFGDPEAIADIAYRAVHELAEKAKLLIKAYYGRLRAVLISTAAPTEAGRR